MSIHHADSDDWPDERWDEVIVEPSIHGDLFGVEFIKRHPNAGTTSPLVRILSEDDGNWFDHRGLFDAAHLSDLITVLTAARAVLANQAAAAEGEPSEQPAGEE